MKKFALIMLKLLLIIISVGMILFTIKSILFILKLIYNMSFTYIITTTIISTAIYIIIFKICEKNQYINEKTNIMEEL